MWHQLSDDHYALSHTDGQDADTVLVIHRRHDSCFFQQLVVLRRLNVSIQHFDSDWDLHVFLLWHPVTLSQTEKHYNYTTTTTTTTTTTITTTTTTTSTIRTISTAIISPLSVPPPLAHS